MFVAGTEVIQAIGTLLFVVGALNLIFALFIVAVPILMPVKSLHA